MIRFELYHMTNACLLSITFSKPTVDPAAKASKYIGKLDILMAQKIRLLTISTALEPKM